MGFSFFPTLSGAGIVRKPRGEYFILLSLFNDPGNLLLVFLPQVWMHGEAEDSPSVVFAHREIPWLVPQVLEGGLQV